MTNAPALPTLVALGLFGALALSACGNEAGASPSVALKPPKTDAAGSSTATSRQPSEAAASTAPKSPPTPEVPPTPSARDREALAALVRSLPQGQAIEPEGTSSEDEAPAFSPLKPPAQEQVEALLRSEPLLASYARRFRLFGPEDIPHVLGRSGAERADLRWTVLRGILRWTPPGGKEAWVLSGTGNGSSLIAVLHPQPDGSWTHGASFVFQGETAPVLVQWDYGSKKELLWTRCVGCAGESGSIVFKDGRVVILQR